MRPPDAAGSHGKARLLAGLVATSGVASAAPRFLDCWSDVDKDFGRERCCGSDGGEGCFDELYTERECCSNGLAMVAPETRAAPLDEATDAAEQRSFESDHAQASVQVSGDVFGRTVRLQCFKRSRASCSALLEQAAADEFRLNGAKELGASGATVVYIGASFGALLIGLAMRFPQARFVAVEPEPVVFRYLAWNVRINGVSDRVILQNAAVGEPGQLRICVHYGRASRTAECDGAGSRHVDVVREVRSVALASLLPEGGGHVPLLVMDCEGCEAKVLVGPVWEALRGRVQRVAGELHYGAFPDAEPQAAERGADTPETALFARGLDVAAALEAQIPRIMPTREGRRLWAMTLGEHLPDPVAGGAKPAGPDDFFGIRIFVYDLPPRFNADLLREITQANKDVGAQEGWDQSDCDFGATPCTETSWAFFYSVARQLATEVVVFQKLLRSPLLVHDARDADLLVVPYFHALDCRLTTWRHEAWASRCQYSDLPHELWAELKHYTPATASRHLFLSSIEPHNMHLSIASQPLLLSVGPRWGDGLGGHVLVPSLVTDAELQPSAWAAVAKYDRPIEFLFTGNVGTIWRRLMREQLGAYRRIVGPEKVLLASYNRQNFEQHGVVMTGILGGKKRQTIFCPCPPGDATSATVRFYDALLSGCIPVVIAFPTALGDGVSWFRHGGPPVEWSYAFAQSIRWRDAVIEVPADMLRAGRFVEVVHAVSKERQLEIAAYIASIRNRLVFDWAGSGPDAFTAIMRDVFDGLHASSVAKLTNSGTSRATLGGGTMEDVATQAGFGGLLQEDGEWCCKCTWLPGKRMPRAKYRWWSHVYGEVYCFPDDTLGSGNLLEAWHASTDLRLRISALEPAHVHVVASPHSSSSCSMQTRGLASGIQRCGALLRSISSAIHGDASPKISNVTAALYAYDVCSNGTWPWRLGGQDLLVVAFREMIARAGHGFVTSIFRKFEHAEKKDSDTIRAVVTQTARGVDPSFGAAFWMHLLVALRHRSWSERTYVFLNTTSTELRPRAARKFLSSCLSRLRDGDDAACIGVVPLAHDTARTTCSVVWRLASGVCSLPLMPEHDGAALGVAVLTPRLLRLLPSATVRALAMQASARLAPYEALSDAERGDLLIWLAFMPASHGLGDATVLVETLA